MGAGNDQVYWLALQELFQQADQALYEAKYAEAQVTMPAVSTMRDEIPAVGTRS